MRPKIERKYTFCTMTHSKIDDVTTTYVTKNTKSFLKESGIDFLKITKNRNIIFFFFQKCIHTSLSYWKTSEESLLPRQIKIKQKWTTLRSTTLCATWPIILALQWGQTIEYLSTQDLKYNPWNSPAYYIKWNRPDLHSLCNKLLDYNFLGLTFFVKL